jgi:hypothetical protein
MTKTHRRQGARYGAPCVEDPSSARDHLEERAGLAVTGRWRAGATQLETTHQLAATAVDPRLDGARGQIEQRFELAIGESLDVAQRQDERSLGIELAQGFLDQRQQLALLRLARGVARVVQGIDGLERQEPEGTLQPASPVVVDAEVAREAQRPGQQRDVAPVAAEVLVQAQEDLLGEVLRAFRSPG